MNWKECGRTLLELDICRDKGSCLEAVRKKHENLSRDSRSPSRGLKAEPPKYKADLQLHHKQPTTVHERFTLELQVAGKIAIAT